MLSQTSPKFWLRGLRSSMRASMILILILGGGLGRVAHRARVQREAVAAIQKAGGRVWYEPWDYKNGRPSTSGKPPLPSWLVDLGGIDCFGTVQIGRAHV